MTGAVPAVTALRGGQPDARDRYAAERAIERAPAGQRLRFGQCVGFIAQRDEGRRVAIGADARIAARHRVLRPHLAGTMGLDDRGNGFGQAELRVRWLRPAISAAFMKTFNLCPISVFNIKIDVKKVEHER